MTQNTTAFEPIDPNVEDGTQLATRLDNQKESYLSTHKGPSAPGYMLAGGFWVQEISATEWALMLKRPDGVSSVVYLFDPATGASDLVRGAIDLSPYTQRAVEETITAKWYFSADLGAYSDLSFARTSGNCFLTVPDGIELRVRNESGTAYGEFSLPGTAAPLTYTIMTREKSDARYGRLTNTQTWTGYNTFSAWIAVPGGGTQTTPQIRFTDTDHGIYSASAGGIHFTIDNTASATVSPDGTSSPAANTIITREKGDARYKTLAGTGTGVNQTSFPIGTSVQVSTTTQAARNSIVDVHLSTASQGYAIGGSGAQLAGNWYATGYAQSTLTCERRS